MTPTPPTSHAAVRTPGDGSAFSRALRCRAFLPACLLLAFGLRLGWILAYPSHPDADAAWYYQAAQQIAAGNGFVAKGLTTARWPVGYPGFLGGLFALCGTSLVVARLANVVLYLGVILLAYGVARRTFASEPTARLAALVLAIYPNHIFYSSLVLSEILFLFLLLLGSLLLLQPRHRLPWTLLAGAVFGAATLTKTQALFIPALILGLSLLRDLSGRGVLRHVALLAAAYAALAGVLAPWTLRNRRVFGRFVLVSTHGGYNLFIGNNPWARGHSKFTERMRRHVGIWGRREGPRNELKHHTRALNKALQFMRRNPLKVVALWPRKFFYTWRTDYEGLSWHAKGERARAREAADAKDADEDENERVPVKAVAQLAYLAVFIGFLRAAWLLFVRHRRATRAERPWAALGAWMFLYFTAVGLVFFGSTRFHFPVIPWLAIYAAAAATGACAPTEQR